MDVGHLGLELLLTLGLLLAGPFFLISVVQSIRWLLITESQIRPNVRLRDMRLGLLAFFGTAAVLLHPEALTEKGIEARAKTLSWLRRLLLVSCVLAALVLTNELVNPQPM